MICVPKDQLAQLNLGFDQSKDGELIELKLSDRQFYKLLNIGLFHRINLLIQSDIDDFEDESINDVSKLRQVIESRLFDREFFDEETFEIANKIRKLFIEALNRKTEIHFYF